jgi:hypothetical protein
MTIYRDPKVKWGGMEVGGIRISHMTGLDEPKTMALTETRSARKPYKVMPLTVEQGSDKAREAAGKLIANIGKAPDLAKLDQYLAGKPSAIIADLANDRPDLHAQVHAAIEAKRASFGEAMDDDDPFAEPAADSYAAFVEGITRRIEAADDDDTFAEIADDLAGRKGLPDTVRADLDAKITGRRRELEAA